MGIIIYGMKTFSKQLGYVGKKETCLHCGKTYQRLMVRYRTWFHLYEVRLFPLKSVYFKMCPICARGTELMKKEAKAELAETDGQEMQSLEFYVKHVLANRPKRLFSTDKSYEFWVQNNANGEEFCIRSGITKKEVKEMQKDRGLKSLRYVREK